MRMVDLLAKKRHGKALTKEEIAFFVRGYTDGAVPDYQAAAFAMAVCFAGMTAEETAALTLEMAASGEMVDLSGLPGVKVDKHSTGGVGDKTTLVVAPIVAACGVPVAKMSGRGLGHTGGTVDKLESIPGYRTALSRREFLDCVAANGIAVAGQSGNLAPADKKLYALRDTTATVDSIPLIASSVMSKKIAAGADAIVLDVKLGSGAFLKTIDEAERLAAEMVAIGISTGRAVCALLTDMDTPLGSAVGNALEIREVLDVLRGHGPGDLTELCLELAANMLFLAGQKSGAERFAAIEACRAEAGAALDSGGALAKFRTLVEAQGGDASYVDDPGKFPPAPMIWPVKADRDGFLTHMDAETVGVASMRLGAGRATLADTIDHRAGILLRRKTGDRCRAGDVLAELHGAAEGALDDAEALLRGALSWGDRAPEAKPLVRGRVYAEQGKVRTARYL